MNIVEQIQSIQKSKVAQDIATAFLAGFIASCLTLVLPDVNLVDPGQMIRNFAGHVSNPIWEYTFWNTSLGGALSAAFGLRLKSAFDAYNNSTPPTFNPGPKVNP